MKRKSIYKSLVAGYLIFSIVTIIFYIIGLNIIGVIWSEDAYNDNFPYRITTETRLVDSMQAINNANGWVEELDVHWNVKTVHGEKKTDLYQYSAKDLLELSNDDTRSREHLYRGFLVSRNDEDGYFLFVFNKRNYHSSNMIRVNSINYHSNTVFIFTLIVLYLFVCGLMCWFIYIRFGKPLKQIETGMQRMKRGEANVQIHLNGAKEFRDIRDTFNMLSYSIQISKQRKQEEEYRKDKMLLDLSHDIRTPIATINNCAQALQEGIVQDEDQEKYYHIIQQKAKRVSNLTEDLFTLIKMKDADYKLSLENKDICEFLREICIEYYVEAEEAGITISANIPEEMCIYAADYDLLSRAIGNLLTNAIKYNRKGHQIFVELEQVDGNKIYIRVCDDGEPVDKDLVPHLFDDFSRGDQTRRTTGGTGLGLSITKAIIEKHGGSIVYRCEGDYNCFEVRIN